MLAQPTMGATKAAKDTAALAFKNDLFDSAMTS
jgi:hypothetical protein